jgi:uncharacterized membrane protein YkvA (DUF1232 family)
MRSLLLTLRRKVLGETWTIPLGLAAALVLALVLRAVLSGSEWQTFGRFALAGLLIATLIRSLPLGRRLTDNRGGKHRTTEQPQGVTPMNLWQWALIALSTLAVLGAACAVTIALIKRKASRLADLAPQVRILCRALTDDPRVLPHHKLVLRALARYLDLPLGLVPDFVPIIGRLDDALITALAIRTAMRSANAELIRQHWPGPQPPPRSLLRCARGRVRSSSLSATASP